ncbi:MAG: alpha/beta hydrolase [Acidimicrobiales bacterium]|nr:alpha/beta hydrolase [Acidimicrobiales bacterium]RZV45243.1 MAG: alpha/beta hydrolase [Acidimicrobiales bacterium]
MADELEWRSLSDADREREYSPSSRLDGDLAPFLAQYAEESEASRRWCHDAGISLQTLSYGSLASQTIDVVTPFYPDPAPLIVFIHGGYWQELSKNEAFGPAADFLARGVAYAAVDYTLAPEATLDEIVAECRSAVVLLHSKAALLAIDPQRIFVAGSSAGGHLAAMVALDPLISFTLAGQILLSGVFELEPLIGTSINDALDLDVDAAHRNSPAHLPANAAPPTLIAFGDNETEQFKRQSLRFGDQLTAAGVETALIEVPDRNHFDVVGDLGRDASALGHAVMQLIEAN